MKQYLPQLALIAALVASLLVSLGSRSMDLYTLEILLTIGINVILAVSLNLVNGHTGQFSLGHAGFMAVGAYGASIMTLQLGKGMISAMGNNWFGHSVVFLSALLVGGICAAIFGWLAGAPSLRLRGDYLAIVTLGFNEVIRVILTNTKGDGPFGGPLGLRGMELYTNIFWVFGIAAICIYVVGAMVNSTYGRGFLAVRDDETAGEAMGINTVRYKVLAFVIGAFFAGLAGGLYAHQKLIISPDGFGFLLSVEVVVMVILGGMGSTTGVVLSAIVVTLLNVWLRDVERASSVSVPLYFMLIPLLGYLACVGRTVFAAIKEGRSKNAAYLVLGLGLVSLLSFRLVHDQLTGTAEAAAVIVGIAAGIAGMIVAKKHAEQWGTAKIMVGWVVFFMVGVVVEILTHRMIFFSLLLIVMMILRPQGLLPDAPAAWNGILSLFKKRRTAS